MVSVFVRIFGKLFRPQILEFVGDIDIILLEPPGFAPEQNPCQLKHQHWTRRQSADWEIYFVRVWKRKDNELVSEFVPLHVSEYVKPAALWIFHDEGEAKKKS